MDIRTEQELIAYLPLLPPEIAGACQELLGRVSTLHLRSGRTRSARPDLHVALIGRFKTGKSRLINTLLEQEVMPCNTDECTAHIVTVKYHAEIRYSQVIRDKGSIKYRQMTEEAFRLRMDLTRGDSANASEPDLKQFRVGLPIEWLKQIWITDTPGFDGVQPRSRERAHEAISLVAEDTDLCLFLLTKGIEQDDLLLMRRIAQTTTEICVVFNMSDNYDREDLEDIRIDALTHISNATGLRPAWFTISAKWQAADDEMRQEIRRKRRLMDEPDPVHEWEELRAFVREVARRHKGWQRRIAELLEIEASWEVVKRIAKSYDRTAQAERVFTQYRDALAARMPPPLGPRYLQAAMDAAQDGRPIPWRLLANFKISPEDIAPGMQITAELEHELGSLYAHHCGELIDFAAQQKNRDRLSEVISRWERFSDTAYISARDRDAIQHRIDWVMWSLSCSAADFRYQLTLRRLVERWGRYPERIQAETQIVVQRLQATLA